MSSTALEKVDYFTKSVAALTSECNCTAARLDKLISTRRHLEDYLREVEGNESDALQCLEDLQGIGRVANEKSIYLQNSKKFFVKELASLREQRVTKCGELQKQQQQLHDSELACEAALQKFTDQCVIGFTANVRPISQFDRSVVVESRSALLVARRAS